MMWRRKDIYETDTSLQGDFSDLDQKFKEKRLKETPKQRGTRLMTETKRINRQDRVTAERETTEAAEAQKRMRDEQRAKRGLPPSGPSASAHPYADSARTTTPRGSSAHPYADAGPQQSHQSIQPPAILQENRDQGGGSIFGGSREAPPWHSREAKEGKDNSGRLW